MRQAVASARVSLARHLEELPRALRRGVERGLERATEMLRRRVSELARAPYGTAVAGPLGELAESVRIQITDAAGKSAGRVLLGPPAERYGSFVEVGTRPHFPPVAALEGWVRRRLGVGGEAAHEVAFLVGRKIAREGTSGRFLFEKALAEKEDQVLALVKEEVERAVGSVAAG